MRIEDAFQKTTNPPKDAIITEPQEEIENKQHAEVVAEQAVGEKPVQVDGAKKDSEETKKAEAERINGLREEILKTLDGGKENFENGPKNLAEKIQGILKNYDVAAPFNTLKIVLNGREEQKLNSIVNPEAISVLYQAVEDLETLIKQPEITLEEIQGAFSKHSKLIHSLFENVPPRSGINDSEESLSAAGNAFVGIYTMNENLAKEFAEADASEGKTESAELKRILSATNEFIIKVVGYVNNLMDSLHNYRN